MMQYYKNGRYYYTRDIQEPQSIRIESVERAIDKTAAECTKQFEEVYALITETNRRLDHCEALGPVLKILMEKVNSAPTVAQKRRKVTVRACGKIIEIEKR